MPTDPSTPSLPPADEEDSGIIDFAGLRNDIGFVLRAPLRHKWLAAGCLLLVILMAAASSLFFKDIYQVSASILAQRNPVMLALSNPGLARGADWDRPTRAARESVVKRDNLIALCQQTGLVDRFLANRSVLGRLRARLSEALSGHQETRQELLEGLADSLETKLWVNVGQEGTVTIVFEWPDKDVAFQIVEAAIQNFLEERHASEVAVLGETITILEASAAKLQAEVDAGLTELERKERGRPVPMQRRITTRPATTTRKDEEVARLESTLTARRRALADLEEFRQRRLAELNAQLAQKESIYAEHHPEVVAAKQSIAALLQPSPAGEALRAEIRDVERDLTQRGSSVAAETSATTELFEPRYALEPEDVRIEYARGRLRFVRDQYSSVLQRLSTARLELETAQAAFKYRYSVITPPAHPKGPKKPYTLLRALAGIIGGAALALFVTTAVDLRSGRLLEEWQIQRQLDLPVLARFPR